MRKDNANPCIARRQLARRRNGFRRFGEIGVDAIGNPVAQARSGVLSNQTPVAGGSGFGLGLGIASPHRTKPPQTRHADPGAGADRSDLRRRGAHRRGRPADPHRGDYFKPDFFNGIAPNRPLPPY